MEKIRKVFVVVVVVVGTGLWSKNKIWNVRRKKEGVSGEEKEHANQKLRKNQGLARKWSQKPRAYEDRITCREAGWKGLRDWQRPCGPAPRAVLINQSAENFNRRVNLLWALPHLDSFPDCLLSGSVILWIYESSSVPSSSSVRGSNINSYDCYEDLMS